MQTVVCTDQFDTITDFEDGTDLFDGITFSAVTRIEQNKKLILSLDENTIVRVLKITVVNTTIADFVQPVV
ncbi:hypothetical protein [cyanobacterium endosymbiont of Rhopalodia gibberula]|uniref:hypothetical protein n=1 Tax=cyanobacterium endosymbiont of Rhopalodia gibberula TaxID=1763363 RepID=UPI000E65293C|nr:hypothetical protein [cyanobacterium endosymbiont of Rhopalodia gibberula]